MIKGTKRFRQAIKNQQDLGNGDFLRLTYHDAEEIAAEIEDELARVSWADGVPAPVDADGNIVPLTTKVMYDKDGEEVRISRFNLTNDGFEQSRWVWNARMLTGFIVNLEDLHLHRPDSWERLEEDIGSVSNTSICAYFGWRGKPCEGCPAFIGENPCCKREAMRDVLRRTKALAERDAKEAE